MQRGRLRQILVDAAHTLATDEAAIRMVSPVLLEPRIVGIIFGPQRLKVITKAFEVVMLWCDRDGALDHTLQAVGDRLATAPGVGCNPNDLVHNVTMLFRLDASGGHEHLAGDMLVGVEDHHCGCCCCFENLILRLS